jgi:hypothetical protein
MVAVAINNTIKPIHWWHLVMVYRVSLQLTCFKKTPYSFAMDRYGSTMAYYDDLRSSDILRVFYMM